MTQTYPVTTCLWFDTEAETAARLYTSLVPGSALGQISYYGAENEHGETGSVLQVEFRLGTQQFVALNGGPIFTHSPAASIQVFCPDQAEVDRLWYGLLDGGGEESQCGWLTDRFGLSWQIIPCLLYTSPSPRDRTRSRMPSSACKKKTPCPQIHIRYVHQSTL